MLGGVGFNSKLERDLGGVLVEAIRPGFGADTGGLEVGDLIVAVGEESLQEALFFIDFDERFLRMILGDLGSTVTVTIERNGRKEILTMERNLPTLPGVSDLSTGSIPFRWGITEENDIQLIPQETLAKGLYCYQVNVDSSTFGDLYCFIQGDLQVTWPLPPGSVLEESLSGLFTGESFELSSCRFDILPGQEVICGDLIVPEDYNTPEGRTIRLHMAIFSPPGAVLPDPVIYLHGGPGGGALQWAAEAYSSGFQFLFPGRYVIFYDQRGTGYSLPRLDCPGLAEEFGQSLAGDLRASMVGWEAGKIVSCWSDLEASGIDLSAYTGEANAADLHSLIKALGIPQVNLLGQSYGTTVALTYMMEYGKEGTIRSVVLDGISPPQANLFAERGQNAKAAWQAILEACKADPSCRATNPDLETAFLEILEKLGSEPIIVEALNPLTGLFQQVVVNDFRLIETVYRAGYQTEWVEKLPAMITTLKQGNTELLEMALESVFRSAVSVDHGLYYAVMCGTYSGMASKEEITAENADLIPPFRLFFDELTGSLMEACTHWPGEPSSVKDQPLNSSIPTLLLSGTFDPITPPTWAMLAATSLDSGFLYEFNEAHGVLGNNTCAQAVTYQFVQNPIAPMDACLDASASLIFIAP